MFKYILELTGSACTEVDRICDRWISRVLNNTPPVPSYVYFDNHSVAPVIRISMQSTRYTKSFQGHQFAVGRSKK